MVKRRVNQKITDNEGLLAVELDIENSLVETDCVNVVALLHHKNSFCNDLESLVWGMISKTSSPFQVLLAFVEFREAHIVFLVENVYILVFFISYLLVYHFWGLA